MLNNSLSILGFAVVKFCGYPNKDVVVSATISPAFALVYD